MKKICYRPFSTNNQYSENVKKAITDSGYQVLSIRQILSNPRLCLQCIISPHELVKKGDYELLMPGEKEKPLFYQEPE